MRNDGLKRVIGFFANHSTASNLILILMVTCGLVTASIINRQFFPDFGLDYITVSVDWPGASATDVDDNISRVLDSELRFIAGVKKITSSAYEGFAVTTLEFKTNYDMKLALSEVESAVSQILTFPQESEKPVVKKLTRYETVSKIVLSGNLSERSLKSYAKIIRDRLLAKGVDRVGVVGARSEEILVNVDPSILRKFDFTVADIAELIGDRAIDLPAGEIAGGYKQVRSVGLEREAQGLKKMEIRSLPSGKKILLEDVADVVDGFSDEDPNVYRNGSIAIELDIQRFANTDALDISEVIKSEMDILRSELPSGIIIEQYDVRANSIKERISLLITNGLGGLALVLIVLFLFMDPKIGIWVAIGIPASLLSAISFMWISGQTINMISLFGMIMAVGIVVDDAIVVGEHADYRFDIGDSASQAAIKGASKMFVPVVCSTLTTIAAFFPLFVISGIIGQIISAIPFVVVSVLVASLIECFLVLPCHLKYGFNSRNFSQHVPFFSELRRRVDKNFVDFRKRRFASAVNMALQNRYSTLAFSFSLFAVSIGLIAGGHVGYQFFPSPEANMIYANVKMLPGTTRKETHEAVKILEENFNLTLASLELDSSDLVVMQLTRVGSSVGEIATKSDMFGGMVVELVSSEKRSVRTSEIISAWREQTNIPFGSDTLTFEAQKSGPPGGDLDIRLRGNISSNNLKAAAQDVKNLLSRYGGLSNIDDNLPHGTPELILDINDRGSSLGLSTIAVAKQLRDFIDGAVAKRFPRNDEEIIVRVQLEKDSVDSSFFQGIYLKSPQGLQVPLKEAVDVSELKGFSRIHREDGLKEVAVTAELNEAIMSQSNLQKALIKNGLPEIAARYNLELALAGKAQEQRETNSDMLLGSILGLTFIYVVLAWVFSSYSLPLVVMAIIPLGFVGAVVGHGLLGFELSILSIFAILGLSGILINDSIVLVTTILERLRTESLIEALVNGSCDRLRAVFLTSATTIGGLTPLLFEKSLQAQFLIPMAITLVFGLALGTLIVLFLVPCLIYVREDILKHLSNRLRLLG